MELQRKTVRAYQVKAADDAPEGILEAIVNVFGVVDSYNERTIPGCAAESLKEMLPKGVWAHDWRKPICKTLEARELTPGDPLLPDEIRQFGGLYIKAQFHKEIDDSWQAYLKLANGYFDEFSIGYENLKTMYDEETEVRELHKIKWYEYGPVLVGACPDTQPLSLKDLRGGNVNLPLDAHSEAVLDAVEGLATRYEQLAEKRLQTSPTLSAKHGERLQSLIERVSALQAKAAAPDADATPPGPDQEEKTTPAVKQRDLLDLEMIRRQMNSRQLGATS